MKNNVNESLEYGDLRRVVKPTLHIDEFKSKMGDDRDICVISLKIMGKDPADDLVNFLEKGYSWIIDADTSSGEMDDGDYIVFVEAEREGHLPKKIMTMVEDLLNLTVNELDDWQYLYYKNKNYKPLTLENLIEDIPLSPQSYDLKYSTKPLDEMRSAAGLRVESRYSCSPQLTQLQVWAGIK
jgi:hypothetical protein